ncbi:MAG: hypothetical protein CMO19_02720 [Thaumarchaeota archaeon]|nr:hypothetical protein [Nitrososphaerota archaeon]|tara:strand:- start:28261 stop:28647 length:387 start_codon:yes stop_codon:yes gene_type:complete
MEKYRGPTNQHSRMERRYFAQLIFGLILILLAIPLETFRMELGDVEIEQPLRPGDNDRPEPVRIQTNTSSAFAYLVIIIGTMTNFHAMYRYRNNYEEIKESYTRPANIFLIIGLVITILAIGISYLSI